MQAYRTPASIRTAADTHPDPELRHILNARIHSLTAFDDPDDLLQVLVLEPGEGAVDLECSIGLTICHSSSTKAAFAEPLFYPAWEVIEAHDHWFEMTFVLSDDGAGVVVLVPGTADADLLAMCRRYAIAALP